MKDESVFLSAVSYSLSPVLDSRVDDDFSRIVYECLNGLKDAAVSAVRSSASLRRWME